MQSQHLPLTIGWNQGNDLFSSGPNSLSPFRPTSVSQQWGQLCCGSCLSLPLQRLHSDIVLGMNLSCLTSPMSRGMRRPDLLAWPVSLLHALVIPLCKSPWTLWTFADTMLLEMLPEGSPKHGIQFWTIKAHYDTNVMYYFYFFKTKVTSGCSTAAKLALLCVCIVSHRSFMY